MFLVLKHSIFLIKIRILDGQGFCIGTASGSNAVNADKTVTINSVKNTFDSFLFYNQPMATVECWKPSGAYTGVVIKCSNSQ
jgi:hypothetical protein